jgi:hypothetical protein
MNKKVIIITRDDSNYSGTGNLAKALRSKSSLVDSFYARFERLSKTGKTKDENGKLIWDASKVVNYNTKDPDYLLKWLDCRWNEWKSKDPTKLRLPNDLVDLLNSTQRDVTEGALYDTITYEDESSKMAYDIYLYYWNRTIVKVKDLCQLLALICKDCDVAFNTPIKDVKDRHYLYIHDDEWGIQGNHLLMKDSELIVDSNKNVLEELKNHFQYVATFQHNNIEGCYFNNILRCKFGEDQFGDKMGCIEDDKSINDFINLKRKIEKQLMEKK